VTRETKLALTDWLKAGLEKIMIFSKKSKTSIKSI